MKLKLSGKLAINSVIMAVIVIGFAAYATQVLQKNVATNNLVFQTMEPSAQVIRSLRTELMRSETLLQILMDEPSPALQQDLNLMHATRFPEMRFKARVITANWPEASEISQMRELFTVYDRALQHQQVIMKSLKLANENHAVNQVLNQAHEKYASTLHQLEQHLKGYETRIEDDMAAAQYAMTSDLETLKNLLQILMFLMLASAAIQYILAKRIAARPIQLLAGAVKRLNLGFLPRSGRSADRSDEIGSIARSIDRLATRVNKVSTFSKAIGNGKLAEEFETLGEHDQLGNALLSMRAKLIQSQENERKRNWNNEGLAKMTEVMRAYSDNDQMLFQNIISQTVKLLDGSVGGFYLVNKIATNSPHLELRGAYAFSLEKSANKIVEKYDGLLGQCWADEQLRHLKEVEVNYANLNSGLGSLGANELLIVPLLVNTEVIGMLEIATYKQFKPHHIEFVKRLSSIIASFIYNTNPSFKQDAVIEKYKAINEKVVEKEKQTQAYAQLILKEQQAIERRNHWLHEKLKAVEKVVGNLEFNEHGHLMNELELTNRFMHQ